MFLKKYKEREYGNYQRGTKPLTTWSQDYIERIMLSLKRKDIAA